MILTSTVCTIAAFEIIHVLVMMKMSLILPPLYDSINGCRQPFVPMTPLNRTTNMSFE